MGHCLKLHLKVTEFADAIQAAASHFKIREVFIEKDYWVTCVLKNLHASKYSEQVVFKGGTSISKAYRVAERFSEDIDLAIVSTPKVSQTKRDDLINVVEKAIALHPLKEIPDLGFTSRNRKFKQSHWGYPLLTEAKHDPARSKIMLEITSSAKTSPSTYMTVRSLIADFLSETKQNDLIREFGLSGFRIKVLSHKRTFVEKIAAVTNACFADEDLTRMKEKIRHLYDLTLLIRDPEIKEFVKSKSFEKMLKDSQKGDLRISAWPPCI